ncbi:MAG TPA: hypothetical protein VNZ44_13870, partial [Pyrinomonadaceae bacterium]|nr:hypothetical protein [Pyrinomonadaceae bacterium]
LEVYEDVYRAEEDAALKQEVTRFKGDPDYKDVAAAPPERAELYDKIVRRDRGEAVAIDADQLIGIADDPNVSPSVRQSAIRAMGADATPTAKERFLNFLRSNSKPTSDPYYVTSLIQLIRIGTTEDKNNILKTLAEGNDPLSTQAIITAIEATGWATGRQALRSISTLESAPRVVRDSAASTLDRLEGARGNTSLGALMEALDRRYTRGAVTYGPGGRDFSGVPGSQWVTLSGPLRDARAYLDVKKSGRDVQLTLKLEGATNLSPGDRLVLWAVKPDGKSVRLGQTVTTQPAQSLPFQIEGRVSLEKFGLLVTVEKGAAAASPSGERVALIP